MWEALRDVDGSTWDYLDFTYDPERLNPVPSSQRPAQSAETAATTAEKPVVAAAAAEKEKASGSKYEFPQTVAAGRARPVAASGQQW